MSAQPRRGDTDRPRRTGGRSARATESALTAALDELVDVGYTALTLDGIAARAGVHRATLYRRWANKEELIADAMLARTARDVPVPDTGSVREDLRRFAHAIVATITSPVGAGLARVLAADAGHNPRVAAAGHTFWARRFALARTIIARGVERGELAADIDPDFVIETLIGPLFLRLLVTDQPLTNDHADGLVDWVLRAGRPFA